MSQTPVPAEQPHPVGEGGRSHGRVSSWILVFVVIAAFVAGGLAMIMHAWWLFWVCLGAVVLSVPAGGLIGIMRDTVAWGHALPPEYQPPRHTAIEPARQELRDDSTDQERGA